MGYLFFESEHKTHEFSVKNSLLALTEAIEEAGVREDGYTEVEILVRGKHQKRILFEVNNTKELMEILKLNSRS